MRQASGQLTIDTHGKGLFDFTGEVASWLGSTEIGDGLLTVFIRHTSASLVIQENADPNVVRDLEAFFSRVVPEEEEFYSHVDEGPDDMPAHIRAALTQTQLSIPVIKGRMALGTWQGIYLYEHRRIEHRRQVVLHVIGE